MAAAWCARSGSAEPDWEASPESPNPEGAPSGVPASLAGLPAMVCSACGTLQPLGPRPRDAGHWRKMALWAPEDLQYQRLHGADVRMPRVPANTGPATAPIPGTLRLGWTAAGGKVEPGSAKAKAKQAKQDRKRARKAARRAGEELEEQPASSSAQPAMAAPRTPRQGPKKRVAKPTSKAALLKVVRRMRAPSRQLLAHKTHFLILTCGEEKGVDLATACGARQFIDCTAGLKDRFQDRALEGCTGESGHLLTKLVAATALVQVLEQLGKVAAAERNRPGGAVLALQCRRGRHRSVGVAALLVHALEATGHPTEVRHLGARWDSWCTCHDGREVCREIQWPGGGAV